MCEIGKYDWWVFELRTREEDTRRIVGSCSDGGVDGSTALKFAVLAFVSRDVLACVSANRRRMIRVGTVQDVLGRYERSIVHKHSHEASIE